MNNINRSALIGLIFVSAGAILLLDNLRLIPWQVAYYVFRWENILIAIGAIIIIFDQNRQAGYILIGLGVIFSLENWFHEDVNIWDFWPVALIVIGIYIISHTRKTDHHNSSLDNDSAKDSVADTAIFGGGDKVIVSQYFKGGTITAIFGGSNIDLTQSSLAEGHQVIDVFYLFGGSKIRVPKDWNVKVHTTGIFGGISDKRKLIDPSADDTKQLHIKGLAIFGGGEITN